MKSTFFLFFLFCVSSMAATIETIDIKTPRGDVVPVKLHLPDGDAKVPLIIMAPGGNYHKENPIFTITADKAVKENIAVLRMDWAYCKVNSETNRCTGRASEDLSLETEDLMSVTTFAQKHSRINSERIILSGKSLGSLVGYSVFKKISEAFYALALLTPLCTDEDEQGNRRNASAESYPGFETVTKPVLMLLGSKDQGATYLPHLWALLSKVPGDNMSVSIVGGDHGLILNPQVLPHVEPNASNLNLAIDSLVAWMKRTLP